MSMDWFFAFNVTTCTAAIISAVGFVVTAITEMELRDRWVWKKQLLWAGAFFILLFLASASHKASS